MMIGCFLVIFLIGLEIELLSLVEDTVVVSSMILMEDTLGAVFCSMIFIVGFSIILLLALRSSSVIDTPMGLLYLIVLVNFAIIAVCLPIATSFDPGQESGTFSASSLK